MKGLESETAQTALAARLVQREGTPDSRGVGTTKETGPHENLTLHRNRTLCLGCTAGKRLKSPAVCFQLGPAEFPSQPILSVFPSQ